jgi:translation elongation factor EF-G
VFPLQVLAIYEPTVVATIITPQQYCGAVMKLAAGRRGDQLEYNFLGGSSSSSSSSSGGSSGSSEAAAASEDAGGDALTAAGAAAADNSSSSSSSSSGGVFGGSMGDRVLLRYQLPLSELAGDFYSRLKSATQG